MRYILFALALLVVGCGGDFGDPLVDWPTAEDEALAEMIVEDTLTDHDYDELPAVFAFFYEGECLPEFWRNFGIVGDDDPDCRRKGKAYVLPWHCFVGVVIRSDRLSGTSYPHELLHCSEFDAFHNDRRLWDIVEPEAIARLERAGL